LGLVVEKYVNIHNQAVEAVERGHVNHQHFCTLQLVTFQQEDTLKDFYLSAEAFFC